MRIIELSEQEIQQLLNFMSRVTLNGQEAFTFTSLINKIIAEANKNKDDPQK